MNINLKIIFIVSGILSILWGLALILSKPLENLTFFTCNREDDIHRSCTRVELSSSKAESKTIPLQDIREAKVEKNMKQISPSSSTVGDNKKPIQVEVDRTKSQNQATSPEFQYRLVLMKATNNEILALTGYANENIYEVEKNKINNFLLTSSELSLNIELERSRTNSLYIGLLLMFAGIVGSGGAVFYWYSSKHEEKVLSYENWASSVQVDLSNKDLALREYQEIFEKVKITFQEFQAEKQSLQTNLEKYQKQSQQLKKESTSLRKDNKRLLEENGSLKASMPKVFFSNHFVGGNAMQESTDQSRHINVGGNVTGSTFNLAEISGSVTNAINQLPDDPDPNQPNLRSLLTQLKEAIETETVMPNADKADLLEQVQHLTEAKQTEEPAAKEGIARKAKKMFEATLKGLPDTAKIVEAAAKLLPMILKVLGVPV